LNYDEYSVSTSFWYIVGQTLSIIELCVCNILTSFVHHIISYIICENSFLGSNFYIINVKILSDLGKKCWKKLCVSRKTSKIKNKIFDLISLNISCFSRRIFQSLNYKFTFYYFIRRFTVITIFFTWKERHIKKSLKNFAILFLKYFESFLWRNIFQSVL